MISEINEIPQAAKRAFKATKEIKLPENVPYLGMGSSYFVLLSLYYQGIHIKPYIASEYYNYISRKTKLPLGILISQSGESSETLWCRELFDKYIAILNDSGSSLATGKNLKQYIGIEAGREEYSSTKSYINTLVTLYNGFSIDVSEAISILERSMSQYEQWAEQTAGELIKRIDERKFKCIYILGNGPNIATTYEAALILTETTKLSVFGMPLAQYDHGPKESAKDTVIISINTPGAAYSRTMQLNETLKNAGAKVYIIDEFNVAENLSPILTIVPLNYLAYFIAKKSGIEQTFAIGNKITRVDKEV